MGLFDDLDKAFDEMLLNKDQDEKPLESDTISEDLDRLKQDLAHEKLDLVLKTHGLIDKISRRYLLAALAGAAQALTDLDGRPSQKETAAEIVALLTTRAGKTRKVLRAGQAAALQALLDNLSEARQDSPDHDLCRFIALLEKADQIGPDEVFVLLHTGFSTVAQIRESPVAELVTITGLAPGQVTSLQREAQNEAGS